MQTAAGSWLPQLCGAKFVSSPATPAVWGGPIVAAVATDILVEYLLLLMWGSYSFILSLSGLVLKQTK